MPTLTLKLKGSVSKMVRAEDGSSVCMSFTAVGDAVNVPSTAKAVTLAGSIDVKSLVADDMKFGDKIFITISTDAP